MTKIEIPLNIKNFLTENEMASADRHTIKQFLSDTNKQLLHGKFDLKSIPASLRQKGKEFSESSFYRVFGKDKHSIQKLQQFFSKYTPNKPLQFALAGTTLVKCKMTGSTLDEEINQFETKFHKLKSKTSIISLILSILVIGNLWVLLANQAGGEGSSEIKSKIVEKIMGDYFKDGVVMIPVITILIAAIVAAFYFMTDTDKEGYSGGPKKSKGKETGKDGEQFVL